MLRGLLLLLNMTGVPRLLFRLMLDRRVPLRLKLIPPAALVYLISPIDLVPDLLTPLGRIDDVLVLIGSLALFLGMAPRDVVSEHSRGAKRGAETRGADPSSKKTVIEGSYRFVDDGEEPRR